jgi:hypothetical protein
MYTECEVVKTKLDNKTDVITILRRRQNNPDQLELFTEESDEAWFEYMVRIARDLSSPFWFSRLRYEADYGPRHPNMWGALTRRMRKEGFRMTGNIRTSFWDSRNGGLEREWERIL